MDRRQAKEILTLYRPGITDVSGAPVADALDFARHDPELSAWFKDYFGVSTIPGTPRPILGNEMPASEPPSAKGEGKGVLPFVKTAGAMIAVAALIVLGVFLWSWLVPKPQNSFASYRDRMARLVQRSFPMKIAVSDHQQLRDYFHTNALPSDYMLPKGLEKLPGKGGAIFTWHNHTVSLIGLNLGAGPRQDLYLFLISRKVFTDAPEPGKTVFKRVGGLMTASWVKADEVYVLTGPGDKAKLEKYLE